MAKINNPTATKGNIVAAFYNNDLWKNLSLGINLVNLEKKYVVGNEIYFAIISYNLSKNVKAKFNLNLENGILNYQDNLLNIENIDYVVLVDRDFTIIKISFDLAKQFGDLKKGNYYYMLFFKNHVEINNLLRDTETQPLEI